MVFEVAWKGLEVPPARSGPGPAGAPATNDCTAMKNVANAMADRSTTAAATSTTSAWGATTPAGATSASATAASASCGEHRPEPRPDAAGQPVRRRGRAEQLTTGVGQSRPSPTRCHHADVPHRRRAVGRRDGRGVLSGLRSEGVPGVRGGQGGRPGHSVRGRPVHPGRGRGRTPAPRGSPQIRDGKYDTAGADGNGVAGGPTVVRVVGLDKAGGKLLCEYEYKVDLPKGDSTLPIDVPPLKGPPKKAGPEI